MAKTRITRMELESLVIDVSNQIGRQFDVTFAQRRKGQLVELRTKRPFRRPISGYMNYEDLYDAIALFSAGAAYALGDIS